MKVKTFSALALGLLTLTSSALFAQQIVTQSFGLPEFTGLESGSWENQWMAAGGNETIKVAADTGFAWGGHANGTGWTNVGVRGTATGNWWQFFIAPGSTNAGTYIYTIFSTAGNATADAPIANLESISVASSAGGLDPARTSDVRILIRDAAGDWHISDQTLQLAHDGGDPESINVTGLTWKAVDAAAAANMNLMDDSASVEIVPGAASTPSLESVTGSGLYWEVFSAPAQEYRNVQSITWTGAAPASTPINVENHDFELPVPPVGTPDEKYPIDQVPGWDLGAGATGQSETSANRRSIMVSFGSSVIQVTDHTIAAGEKFYLSADARSSWNGLEATIRLFYQDGATSVALAGAEASASYAGAGNTTNYAPIILNMDQALSDIDANAVGKKVGIELAITDGSYVTFDDVYLGVLEGSAPIEVTKPGVPTVGNLDFGNRTADVTIDVGTNPAGAEFAIQIDTIDLEPALQATSYVQGTGALDATPVWQTAATWGTPVTVGPLPDLTNLTFTVLVRSPGASESTSSDASEVIIVPVELDSFVIE